MAMSDAPELKVAALQALRPDDWPEAINATKAVIRSPNGVESGNWYSKPNDETRPYTRADLPATDAQALANPKVQALVEALLAMVDNCYSHDEESTEAFSLARAALAAIKEGHDDA